MNIINNILGFGVNAVYIYNILREWLTVSGISEAASILVPILACIWWVIKIYITIKNRRK